MKKEDVNDNPQSNPVVANIVKLVFEVVKHFLNDVEHTRSFKKFDSLNENIDKMKNTVSDMENKIDNYIKEIENLKMRILWNNMLFLGLLVVLIIQMFI